ncbi:MAG: hypothetical protein JNK23_13140 [Opitutaceae bacterium]|nr:hypothetical protein [Opitutaceae bacterium]
MVLVRSIATCLCLGATSLLPAADSPAFAGPQLAGELEAPPKLETSGLAASRRNPGLLWTHDDSGGAAEIHAVTTTGHRTATLSLRGVKNEDWEDLAAFEQGGQAWLLIADTGDNDAKRQTVRLHVVEEPTLAKLKPGATLEVAPAYTLRLRYPDGPRDCESVAVDAAEGAIYLLTKRDNPPRLYRAPLANPGAKVVEARFVCEMPALIGRTPVDDLIKRVVGKKFSWPTGMDFSADGRSAVVLTYGEPLVFVRAAGESWASAFQRTPQRLAFHGLPQAEAVCFSTDGRVIFVASESTRTLVRYTRAEH